MESVRETMTEKIFDLKGRVAIVTGGAGHLGTAISEALAEYGASVYIASRDIGKCRKLASEISDRYGVTAGGMELDIRSFDSITKCFSDIYKEAGRIDILVNNASFSPVANLATVSEKEWLEGKDGTINGVFRCTKAVLPYMTKQASGSIINISSMYGMVSPDPSIYGDSGYDNPPHYGAGKAGIIQFTKYTACHLAKDGIRVNSLSPGPFPNSEVQKNTEFIDRLNKKVPMGRIGQPEELKGAVIFLASDASSYVTGVNLPIDGGWTSW